MTDPFDPQRFLDAQSSVYPLVLDELRRGRKQSHRMWFIFPQLAGLGHSAMAQRFAIASRAEAVAYLGAWRPWIPAQGVYRARQRNRGSDYL